MKKIKSLLILGIVLTLLTSCATTEFNLEYLSSNDNSLEKKLPNLEIKKADTVQIGSSNAIESNSYIYTIFSREIENNICDTNFPEHGKIAMNLIYSNSAQNPGWSSKNVAMLEFEIHIYNNNGDDVWHKSYRGNENYPDGALTFANPSYNADSISNAADNAMAQMVHKLIDEFKVDVQIDYNKIVSNLQ